MAWINLFIAGALEVAWAAGLKKLGMSFSLTLGALTFFAMIVSFAALYAAMQSLPLGIAYPVWTGIGTVGSVLLGFTLFGDTLSLATVSGTCLLVVGMFLIGSDAH
ncbi:DMT family transporter [Pacificoceanicola onchidii]|uniref:DMT family transporter n=1 Tax=Pacificoceanicola onchidii TaxID=2562685 RepID=UPI0010A65497|nr:multidrug efflux SMR transporter [Pacificoceanicola onchidii]